MTKGQILIFIIFYLFIRNGFGQNFTQQYIKEQRGKWNVEIPEVQELVHIIIAISPTGVADSNMVEHRTKYYKEVIDHFGKYNSHEVVRKIDSKLKHLYAHLKMDACGFYFDSNGKIIKDKTYKRLNWSPVNFISPLVNELELFAKQTGFREFFQQHQEYYNRLIVLIRKQMPIEKQWKWLEERFPIKYDNYRITFSPLTNGSHSTNRFESKDFKQTVMFISGPIGPGLSETMAEGLMSRVVFTEIDHNYVNPISDNYKKTINRIFKDRNKWTASKDSRNYGSPYAVFNEYMTWAVFTLYAFDVYNEQDFLLLKERVERQMIKYRGFSKFKDFNEKLLEIYKERKQNENISELYPHILDWCNQIL